MKMSRAERKSFNLGKRVGYSEGYVKGLHDGNPFNRMTDAIRSMKENLTRPEVRKCLKMLTEAKDEKEGE